MSYYILPKINNLINVNPSESSDIDLKTYISHSLNYYYNEINKQIYLILNEPDSSLNYMEITKIVNPYEYIFSKVPSSKFSVSKLKPNTNIFYDFLEVSTTLNVFDYYKNKSIKSLHISPNSIDTIECLEMIRENYSDEVKSFIEINEENIKQIGDEKFHFIFCESNQENLNQYIISFINIFMVILKNQINGGTSIIKISNIFYKPIIDIIYLLSSIYEKIYILKPNTSNITTFEKYIICKNFQINDEKNINFRFNYFRLFVFLKKLADKKITSILDFDIPYYFTIKLDDINIILGQQQLESLDMTINILKNKNKEEKMETLKKTNIQKSVAWCEKYKIPCNKFFEKTNIFLPIIKKNINESLANEGVEGSEGVGEVEEILEEILEEIIKKQMD